MDNVSYALGLGIGSQLKSMGAESLNIDDFARDRQEAQGRRRGLPCRERKERRCNHNSFRTSVHSTQRGHRQVTKGYRYSCLPLRGFPHQRHSIRQQHTTWRTCSFPSQWCYSRLDRRPSAHEGRWQEPFLHPLPPRLR